MSHLDDFAGSYYVLHQISPDRVQKGLSTFRNVEGWLGRELHMMTADDLSRWMTEQVAAGYHVNTIRFWRNLMGPYWTWAQERGLMSTDQWLALRRVKNPRGASATSTPRPYKRTDVARFWEQLDAKHPRLERVDYFFARYQRGTSPWLRVAPHLRNVQLSAIVHLALTEGLRASEIRGLTLEAIDPNNAYLPVRGKRSDHREKLRDVPYSPACRAAVLEWLTLRRVMKPRGHRSPWLALSRMGGGKPQRPMSEEAFEILMSTIGEGWELHRMRHTYATERLRAGMPLQDLQRCLGHSTLQQTLAYAELLREDLAKSMDASEAAFMRAVGRRAA